MSRSLKVVWTWNTQWLVPSCTKFDIYHIHSVQENRKVKVFTTPDNQTNRPDTNHIFQVSEKNNNNLSSDSPSPGWSCPRTKSRLDYSSPVPYGCGPWSQRPVHFTHTHTYLVFLCLLVLAPLPPPFLGGHWHVSTLLVKSGDRLLVGARRVEQRRVRRWAHTEFSTDYTSRAWTERFCKRVFSGPKMAAVWPWRHLFVAMHSLFNLGLWVIPRSYRDIKVQGQRWPYSELVVIPHCQINNKD